MIRRKDVAERAGTSPAVVSYVLNGGSRPVAPQTRERVLKAVAELNYRPNRIARSLRMNKTMTLGLVSPDSANPFFAELSNAIEDAAFNAGYTVLIGNSAEDLQRQAKHIDAFIDHQVDGLLLVPAEGTTEEHLRQLPKSTPAVILDRVLPDVDLPKVVVNNAAGAAIATKHLFDHGRTRIACIAGPRYSMPSEERVQGFLEAARAAGMNGAVSELVRHVPFGRRSGYLAASKLLREEPVDSFFVTSDEQAAGVLRAIAEVGLKCPEDVAVVSFDGIRSSAYTVPTLTSMAQPFSEIGAAALEVLLKLINGSAVDSVTELEARLTQRRSCGCPDPDPGDLLDPELS